MGLLAFSGLYISWFLRAKLNITDLPVTLFPFGRKGNPLGHFRVKSQTCQSQKHDASWRANPVALRRFWIDFEGQVGVQVEPNGESFEAKFEHFVP